MAIGFDNALQPQVNSGVTSVTRSFTVTGSTPAVLSWALSTSAGDFSSITYNGVALSKIGEVNQDAFSTELHSLLNASTGANNLVWNNATSATFVTTASSYSGVSTSFSPNTNTNTGSGATVSGSLTTGSDNSWVVWLTRTAGASPDATGTNYTRRVSNVGNGVHIGDTNAAVTPAGATSVSVGLSGSNAWGLLMYELIVDGGGGSSIASVDGVTRANIGSFMGVASANIGSINGVAD